MASLTTSLRVKLATSYTGTNVLGAPTANSVLESVMNLANGVAAGQADIPFFAERSVAASTNDDIDLAGVLTGAFGATITAAKMKVLAIYNGNAAGVANLSDLTIGLGTNPFLGFLGGTLPTIGPIKPGGILLIACPALAGIGTVTGGASDILRVANGAGGTALYQVGFIATSS